MEEHFSPLAEVVSSLVEIVSSMQASCPLDELIIVLGNFLLGSEIGVVEFLLPAFHFVQAIKIVVLEIFKLNK
jgi:hypothetical protein